MVLAHSTYSRLTVLKKNLYLSIDHLNQDLTDEINCKLHNEQNIWKNKSITQKLY